jgi:hypothetical protein
LNQSLLEVVLSVCTINCPLANFACLFAGLQDTLREPPRAAVSMRKAITASMSTCYVLYMLVGCLGYAALGDDVPASILQVRWCAFAQTVLAAM